MKSIKMNTCGFVSLAAIFAVTMAQPAQNTSVEAVIEGINHFAPIFFREVASSNPENLIVSPLSASIALAMFAYGSRGKTEKEFKRVLHLPEKSVGRIGYINLIDSLNATEDVDLRFANIIFINEEFTIEQTYHELIRTSFRSNFFKSNFFDIQKAVKRINDWIKENINNRYTEFLTADIFPETPNMVLINIIYFKALWGGQFLPLLGGNKPFHVTTSQVKNVPIIYRFGRHRYGVLPELKARIIELRYENEEFSMIIILPDAIDGLTEVEQKLAHQDITDLVETLNRTKVEVYIPKFKVESTLNLIPPLKNMGLHRAFNEDSADFTEIFDIGLYIDSFIQKAFIEVDERGTQTDSSVRVGGVPRGSKIFYVDHPFHLSILKDDRLTNKKFELFSATVLDPS